MEPSGTLSTGVVWEGQKQGLPAYLQLGFLELIKCKGDKM
jgi:hypothetical protein